jgi:hypothetical protein
MSIYQTYSELSTAQRGRMKERQRSEDFANILNIGKGFAEQARNNAAEEFNKDGKIREDLMKQEEALKRFKGIETVYNAGQNHFGGLGGYLMRNNGEAYNLVSDQLNMNIDERLVKNADEIDKTRQNMMRELVYGRTYQEGDTIYRDDGKGSQIAHTLKKGDTEIGTKEAGLLKAYESAYNKGKTLMNIEDYTTYLQDRSGRPESVGGYLVGRLFGNYKNQEEANKDYVNRALSQQGIDPNKEIADRQAFDTAHKAINAGVSIGESTKLASLVKDNLKNIEMLDRKQYVGKELMKQEYTLPDGSTRTISYFMNKYKDLITGEISTGTDVSDMSANPGDAYSERYVNDKKSIFIIREEQEVLNTFTGKTVKTLVNTACSIDRVYGMTCERIDEKEKKQQPVTSSMFVDPSLLVAQNSAFRKVLVGVDKDIDKGNDRFTKAMVTFYGEDIYSASNKGFIDKEIIDKDILTQQNSLSSFITTKHPEISDEGARLIAARIAIEDAFYSEETGGGGIVGIGGYNTSDVSGYVNDVRILGGINKLVRENNNISLRTLLIPQEPSEDAVRKETEFLKKLVNPKDIAEFAGNEIVFVPNAPIGALGIRPKIGETTDFLTSPGGQATNQGLRYWARTNLGIKGDNPVFAEHQALSGEILTTVLKGSKDEYNNRYLYGKDKYHLTADLTIGEAFAFLTDPEGFKQSIYNMSPVTEKPESKIKLRSKGSGKKPDPNLPNIGQFIKGPEDKVDSSSRRDQRNR